MTDAQAAAVLRTMSNPLGASADPYTRNCEMAAERGACALEFKAWLLEPDPILGDLPIVRVLWSEHAGSVADFLSFCEAKFEESKRHG